MPINQRGVTETIFKNGGHITSIFKNGQDYLSSFNDAVVFNGYFEEYKVTNSVRFYGFINKAVANGDEFGFVLSSRYSNTNRLTRNWNEKLAMSNYREIDFGTIFWVDFDLQRTNYDGSLSFEQIIAGQDYIFHCFYKQVGETLLSSEPYFIQDFPSLPYPFESEILTGKELTESSIILECKVNGDDSDVSTVWLSFISSPFFPLIEITNNSAYLNRVNNAEGNFEVSITGLRNDTAYQVSLTFRDSDGQVLSNLSSNLYSFRTLATATNQFRSMSVDHLGVVTITVRSSRYVVDVIQPIDESLSLNSQRIARNAEAQDDITESSDGITYSRTISQWANYQGAADIQRRVFLRFADTSPSNTPRVATQRSRQNIFDLEVSNGDLLGDVDISFTTGVNVTTYGYYYTVVNSAIISPDFPSDFTKITETDSSGTREINLTHSIADLRGVYGIEIVAFATFGTTEKTLGNLQISDFPIQVRIPQMSAPTVTITGPTTIGSSGGSVVLTSNVQVDSRTGSSPNIVRNWRLQNTSIASGGQTSSTTFTVTANTRERARSIIMILVVSHTYRMLSRRSNQVIYDITQAAAPPINIRIGITNISNIDYNVDSINLRYSVRGFEGNATVVISNNWGGSPLTLTKEAGIHTQEITGIPSPPIGQFNYTERTVRVTATKVVNGVTHTETKSKTFRQDPTPPQDSNLTLILQATDIAGSISLPNNFSSYEIFYGRNWLFNAIIRNQTLTVEVIRNTENSIRESYIKLTGSDVVRTEGWIVEVVQAGSGSSRSR